MREYRTERGVFYHGDCMQGMETTPDKFYDIAIVDPPYGINVMSKNNSTIDGKNAKDGYIRKARNWEKKEWDCKRPDKKYFDEIIRVSKNQIVWGGNYFTDILSISNCWIIWDKCRGMGNEMAWSNIKNSIQIFCYMWNGELYQGESIENGKRMQGNIKLREKIIHPTQKPIALYKWIVINYVHFDMRILDTHVGSASSLIAYEEAGLEYVGYELDADYYKAAVSRIKDYRMQGQLFTPAKAAQA